MPATARAARSRRSRMEAVRRQFETNVFGLVRLTQLVAAEDARAALGQDRQRGLDGRAPHVPRRRVTTTRPSTRSEAISDALRFELRGFGIDVVLLEPGLITTEFGEAATASMAEPCEPAARRRPLRALQRDRRRGHRGRLRRPDAPARRRARPRGQGDRARDHPPPPAGADHDHAIRQALDRRRAAC